MAIEPDGPEFHRMSNSPSTSGMGFDNAHPAGWIVGDFFIEDFPAPFSCTGIYKFAPLPLFFLDEEKEGNASCTDFDLNNHRYVNSPSNTLSYYRCWSLVSTNA